MLAQRTLLVAAGVVTVAACAWISWRARTPAPAVVPVTVAAAHPAFSGDELVDSPSQCEDVCGSECAGDGGRLRCPRRCSRDGECGSGAICTLSRLDAAGEHVRRCLASECKTLGSDLECGAGRVCLYEAHPGGGAFRCHAAGERKAGEACTSEDQAAIRSCGVGLQCDHGTCLPARCRADDECPRGAKCLDLAGGLGLRQCRSSCSGDEDCGAGRRCVTLPWQSRVCGASDDAACLRDGCPQGSTCNVDFHVSWGLHASCVRTCDGATGAAGAGCAPGETCVRANHPGEHAPYVCQRSCASGAPRGCPPSTTCRSDEAGRFTCRYDVEAAGDRYFRTTYDHRRR